MISHGRNSLPLSCTTSASPSDSLPRRRQYWHFDQTRTKPSTDYFNQRHFCLGMLFFLGSSPDICNSGLQHNSPTGQNLQLETIENHHLDQR